ncbi:MAG: diacylglycerol kinase, partial [Candidatus Omnitrophica bacterium]|nr:diacylglycerol kinase [Candidatus Omnitrophota bacterium]
MAKDQLFRDIFKIGGFRQSFKVAVRGVIYLFLYHRNMRIIFMFGIAALLLGFWFKLRGIELVALCIT